MKTEKNYSGPFFDGKPLVEGQQVMFNDHYAIEGQVGTVSLYNGNYGVVGFDPTTPKSRTDIRREAVYDMHQLAQEYMRMKKVVKGLIQAGQLSEEVYDSAYDEVRSNEQQQSKGRVK